MRIDIGDRAHAIMDNRAATIPEFKHAEERYRSLMKYSL